MVFKSYVLVPLTIDLLPVLCRRSRDLPLLRRAKLQPALAEPPRVDEEADADLIGQEVVNAHNAIHLAATSIVFSVAETAHLSACHGHKVSVNSVGRWKGLPIRICLGATHQGVLIRTHIEVRLAWSQRRLDFEKPLE